MAVDEDTKKNLEDVRKGKPRRFVMVGKGVKILSLVVYKKGSVEKYKKQAKEEGSGRLYFGVVDGKGVNISFKLLRSDGFDKPPGKELILKDFLKTEADMKCMPAYEIVDVLPDVDEEDDDTPPVPPPPEPTARLADQFKARLIGLVPRIKQAAGTPAGEQARQKAAEAGELAQKSEFSPANERLDEAERLLDQDVGTAPDAPPPVATGLADSFKTRLAALIPRIKQAAGTPAGDAARQKAGEAGESARKLDFERGHALLNEAEQVLNARDSTGEAQTARRDENRARLARTVSKGGNPFPEPGAKLNPDVREVFLGQVETATAELTSKLNSLYAKIRALHAEIKKADEDWRRERAPELLKELAGYRAAIEATTAQIESLSP